MLFNSFEFFLFLTVVLLINFSLPQRFRVGFLLLASYFFYAQWQWEFCILLLLQTCIHYGCALAIARATSPRQKKYLVGLAAIGAFGILAYFKYLNFFADSFQKLLENMQLPYLVPHLNILLPVGISFYTFQAFGYVVDVYRGKCIPERNFLRFGLFCAFFPQIAAGPIGRAPQLLPQFQGVSRFDPENIAIGLQLILWGLFKKVVIADRLALYVNQMYADPASCTGATLLLTSYLFAIQIYCDFSGYSEIAIGSARLFGYRLMQNFNLPYFSENITGFWKRWHISLTSWFRDYLYIPLGGNRVSQFRWMLNIMIVFIISGLWHGANWTFVIWGGLHGIYYFIEYFLKKITGKVVVESSGIIRVIKVFFTFHAVVFAWIFFRAATFSDALTVIIRIGHNFGHLSLGSSQISFAINFVLILLLAMIDYGALSGWCRNYFSSGRFPAWARVIGYASIVAGIALLGVTSSGFIYLQF